MGLVRDSSITLFSQMATMFFGLVSGIIVARYFGPSDKGIYALVFLLTNLIVNIVQCGIAVAPIYYIGKKVYEPSDVLANILTIGFVISGVGMVLFILILKIIQPSVFSEIKPQYFYISIVTIPTGIIVFYLRYFLMSINQVKKFNYVAIVRSISISFNTVVFVVILKMNIVAAIVAVCIGETISLFCVIFMVNKHSKIKLVFDKTISKDLFTYGLKSHAGEVLDLINMRLDMWMISYYLGIEAVGFYSVALISQRIVSIPDSVGVNLFRKLSNSDGSTSNMMSKIVVRNLIFMLLPLVIFFSIFAKQIIVFLYSDQFLPAVEPFIILLPTVFFFTISKNLKAFLAAKGRPEISSYASILSLASNVIMNFTLIPRWGINGSAFATTMSTLAYAALILVFYIRISGNSFKETLVVRKSDIELYRTLWS